MSLEEKIQSALKDAMKAKNSDAMKTLRAVKSELLLIKTSADFSGSISEDQEIAMLQKMVKQRKDAAAIFQEQNRQDLADIELAEVDILMQFLPEQLDEATLTAQLKALVSEHNATSMKDMGKIMGIANKIFAGKADGKTIANIIKQLLQ